MSLQGQNPAVFSTVGPVRSPTDRGPMLWSQRPGLKTWTDGEDGDWQSQTLGPVLPGEPGLP